jgi:hypothetical protein
MFSVYGGKCLSCKAVHIGVEKFSEGRSKVADDAWPRRLVEIATEGTVRRMEELILADRRMTTIDSIQYSAWSFEVWESVRTVGAQGTEESRKKWTEWICPCNISYSMQMKEMICLTGLLLGTNHGCITSNPNQSVLQCNGNIPIHHQTKSLRLRRHLRRLWLPCFVILVEYC